MGRAKREYVRRGSLAITKKQYDILCLLRAGKEADQPLVKLEIKDRYDERTLQIMQWDKDWIVDSTKVFEDERRFAITTRGLKLLNELETPLERSNAATGLCFRCGIAPRYISPKGRRLSYCLPCHNLYNNGYYAKNGKRYNTDRRCSRCKTKRRYINGKGHVEAYCHDCRLIRMREHRQRKLALNRAQANAGTLPLCAECGAGPIYFTPTNVYVVCMTCLNQRRRKNARRVKLRRMKDIQQRLKGFKVS